MDLKMVGSKIRQQRKLKGLTQADLASKIGISLMSMRRYETGERVIQESILQKIAETLNIELFDLLPDETQNQFKSVPQYFNSIDEDERELARQTEKVLIQNALNKELYDKLINITDVMHDAAMDGLSEISDEELAGVLIGSFNSLNKFGKREAVERVAELELIPKYQKEKE